MQERIVALDGSMNFRDLGGYQGTNGMVKWGKIYRADGLSSLSEADKAELAKRKVTVDIDLRSDYEMQMSPDKKWPGQDYLPLPLYGPKELSNGPELGDNYLGRIYQNTLLSSYSQGIFKQVIQELINLPDDQALVFHCSAGKDRTGMTAALILMALGIDDDQISKDYLLTNELYFYGLSKKFPTNDQVAKIVDQMNSLKGEGAAILGITHTIREMWGSFANFMTEQLGFSQEDYKTLLKKYTKKQS
ncbi:MAG: tyrosine-protein phosphatase [Lactobacillus sp.]|nr:tyrosine-protein phosphatase [Lactobacillus sp.]